MDISVGEGYFIVFQFRYSRISSPKKHKNKNASSLHGKRLLTSVRVTNSSQSYKFYIFFSNVSSWKHHLCTHFKLKGYK